MSRIAVKNLPFFAVLFPLFFVLHGYQQYVLFVPFSALLALAIRYLLGSLLLFGIFLWLYKETIKAGMAVFITLLFFCLFGALHDFLQKFLQGTFFVKYIFLLPLLAIIYIALLISLRHRKIKARWTAYLNLVFVVLLIIDAGTILYKVRTVQKPDIVLSRCDTCAKPDVYLIVVDGYAGKEQLHNDFSFNNDFFLDSLMKMGFRVLAKSSSNYVRTEFSMASLLNIDYHRLNDYTVTEQSLFYCYRRIAKNNVVAAFHQQGYKFVNNSIFDIDNEEAPVSNSFLITGANLIESETLFSRLKRDVYIPFLMDHLGGTALYKDFVFQAYKSDENLVDRLEKIVHKQWQQPRFVYTHLLMTHFPYYFREDGRLNDMQNIRVDNYEDKDLYLANLKYTNKRLLSLVQKILQASRKPPVIVLMSDHGFRYAANPVNAFSNLAAIYLPGKQYGLYYDTASNVNQFRILFNTVFHQQLPLLEDRNGEVPQRGREEHKTNSLE
jgi:hypothetical protein